MRIQKHLSEIELVADNKEETEILKLLFIKNFHVKSYGYDRFMPKTVKGRIAHAKRLGIKDDLEYWLNRMVLSLEVETT